MVPLHPADRARHISDRPGASRRAVPQPSNRPNGITRLEPKVMLVLVCLADRAGQMVPKERLFRAAWADTAVSDDVLTRAISELRRLFEDDPKQPRVIETIPKAGYRLIAPVTTPRRMQPQRRTPCIAHDEQQGECPSGSGASREAPAAGRRCRRGAHTPDRLCDVVGAVAASP